MSKDLLEENELLWKASKQTKTGAEKGVEMSLHSQTRGRRLGCLWVVY